MLSKVLENRRKYVAVMMQSGLSTYDIAKYFQVSPTAISRTLKSIGLEKKNMENIESSQLDAIIMKRDEILENKLKNGDQEPEEILAELGFHHSIQKSKFYTIADDWLEEHSKGPEFDAIFNGATAQSLASQKQISTNKMNKKLRDLGIDVKEVAQMGKKLRELQSMAQVWELYSFSFTQKEICEYLSLDESYVRKCCDCAKQQGMQSKMSGVQITKEELDGYLKSGINQFEIAEITGIHGATITKLKKDFDLKASEKDSCIFDYKMEKRRELVYRMYTEDLLTQQEIADRLGLTRATVISDIRKHKSYHPEIVDKTYLWRQRNIAEGPKAQRIDKKEKALKYLSAGYSIAETSRITGISTSAITKYAKEDGYETQTESNKTYKKRKAFAEALSKKGYNIAEIATEMGVSKEKVANYLEAAEKTRETRAIRAEELKLSWNGMPTTDITVVMGRSRAAVLHDQHQTSNVLRNNAEALEYVAQKGGDVTEEAKESPLIRE